MEYFEEAFGAWAASQLTQEERARETRHGRIANYIDKERYAGLRSDLCQWQLETDSFGLPAVTRACPGATCAAGAAVRSLFAPSGPGWRV